MSLHSRHDPTALRRAVSYYVLVLIIGLGPTVFRTMGIHTMIPPPLVEAGVLDMIQMVYTVLILTLVYAASVALYRNLPGGGC